VFPDRVLTSMPFPPYQVQIISKRSSTSTKKKGRRQSGNRNFNIEDLFYVSEFVKEIAHMAKMTCKNELLLKFTPEC
jgi:hypothetical protein